MKKIFFSLILCFILLGSSLTFSACKKDNFKLSSMYKEYETITSKYENVKLTEDKLTFEYNEKFTQEINTNLPYTNIKDFYNPMFDYSMSFVNGFIKKCSNDEIKSTKKQRKNIKTALNNFDIALAEVNSNISTVEELVNIDPASTSAHIKLQGLFSSYENLYRSIFELSNYLQDIYFDYASEYNTNPTTSTLNKFDSDKHVILLNAKIANAKVELTETFIEKYIKNFDYSTKLTEKTGDNFNSLPVEFDTFNQKIKNIDKSISITVASAIIKENSIKKENFYNFCIEAYNIEQTMKDHNPMFKDAKNSIVYMVEKNNINITNENKLKLESIDKYDLLANNYVDSIEKIVNLLEI